MKKWKEIYFLSRFKRTLWEHVKSQAAEPTTQLCARPKRAQRMTPVYDVDVTSCQLFWARAVHTRCTSISRAGWGHHTAEPIMARVYDLCRSASSKRAKHSEYTAKHTVAKFHERPKA
ncbi:hypothetical protein MRX96_003891 [Rhipicephalus microplus]